MPPFGRSSDPSELTEGEPERASFSRTKLRPLGRGLPSSNSPMDSPASTASSFASTPGQHSFTTSPASSSHSSTLWDITPKTSASSMAPPPTSASRDEVAPWESHTSLPTSLKPSRPAAHTMQPPSASNITSKLAPPPHPAPSSSPSKAHLHPPSASTHARGPAVAAVLHRSFSQRPPSVVHAFANRVGEGGPLGARNFSDPTSGRRAGAPTRSSTTPSAVSSSETSANSKGKAKARVYLVEHDDLDILDHESLMAETMRYRVAPDESNTFVRLEEGEKLPARVLDIGCGLGLWCVSQAQEWKTSTFVGLDISSSHIDLDSLAELQAVTGGARQGGIDWEDVHSRVEWCQADFLETLPFDSGSFDLVHLRWINLGVPEPKWQELLEEAARVLKKGTGILEIVETSNALPLPPPIPPPQPPSVAPSAYFTSRARPRQTAVSDVSTTPRHTPTSSLSGSPLTSAAPPSQHAQYAAHLQSHLVQPTANIVIRPAFLMTTGLDKMKIKSESSWVREEVAGEPEKRAPGVLSETSAIWAESMFPTPPPTPTTLAPNPHQTLPSPYAARTAHLLANELAETYGLEGYATRLPRASDSPSKRGRFSKKILGMLHGGAGGGGGTGGVAIAGNGGKVESWAWVGRKSG